MKNKKKKLLPRSVNFNYGKRRATENEFIHKSVSVPNPIRSVNFCYRKQRALKRDFIYKAVSIPEVYQYSGEEIRRDKLILPRAVSIPRHIYFTLKEGFNFRSINVRSGIKELLSEGKFSSAKGKGIKYKHETLTAYVKPCSFSTAHHIALHGETASETGYRSNYFMADNWKSIDDFLQAIPEWLKEWHEKNGKLKKKMEAQLSLF